jgi:hypothetical protein
MSQCAARCVDGNAKTRRTTHGTSNSAVSPNSGTTQRAGRQPLGSVTAREMRAALNTPPGATDISFSIERTDDVAHFPY